VIEDEDDVSLEQPIEPMEADEDHCAGEEETLHDSQEEIQEDADAEKALEPLNVELHPVQDDAPASSSPVEHSTSSNPIFDDPSDSDDGEGEWITPGNVGLHKSRALDLLPDSDVIKGKRKGQDEAFDTGCMTADFAMQNVLLQMGLNLVGVEGKRIEKVKSWVLRCHACFKYVLSSHDGQVLMNILLNMNRICKDSSKKFCPSCGNPSLLRASVTVAAPGASPNTPAMQVHLKPNFQYKIRGTKYAIPAPKPGSAKHGPGGGLILREDQIEYVRAKKKADGKREREEAKMLKGILGRGVEGNMGVASVGSWMDPDWVPEIISAGTGGKGRTVRSAGMDGDMPQIGYGKKNPNARRKHK
jgi:RNA-binding protein NOB1